MTELAKQLQNLRGLSEPVPTSFLFDPKIAMKIDKDIIYTIGINGFEELRDLDSAFATFFSDLLDEAFANEHCHFETLLKPQISEIEKELTRIVSLISPHFLNPGCHKLLEFLIRFYKVQTTVRDDVIYSLLPFHGTKYFIRFLMICKLDGIWHFLTRHQHSGYILQRSDIVKQCMHEFAILQGILARAEFSSTHLRFACAVVVEMVHTVSKLSETLMQIVLGFVAKILPGDKEHKDLAMAIIGHTALRHNFSPQYLQGVITDLLTYSDSDKTKQIQTISLLLSIHVIPMQKTKNLPSSIIKLLTSKDSVSSIVHASKTSDVTAVILPISSKLFHSILKSQDPSTVNLLCREASLLSPSLRSLLSSLFTHYLNIEKSKKSKLSPHFCGILSTLWQIHGEILLTMIPGLVSEMSTTETKPLLYSLISQALSGMPFDSNSDLPIVLALSSPSPYIRKSAISQISSSTVALFTPSLKLLISRETDFEVLEAALGLELTEEFYEILLEKYRELSAFPVPPVQCLRGLFRAITQDSTQVSTQHAKVILLAYDNPQLREMCPEAVARAGNFRLFAGYKKQELPLFITQQMVKKWGECSDLLLELADCPLVYSLIPQIIQQVSLKHNGLEKMLEASAGLVNWLVQKETEDFSIFESIVRALPAAGLVPEGMRGSCHGMLKNILKYLIPKASELCKEILAKNYPNEVLQVLCELSEHSPEALHLAICVGYHSEYIESLVYTIPFLLINLGRAQQFRNSSIISIEQLLQKSLPNIHLQFNTAVESKLSRFGEHIKEIRKFLRKLLKFKTGLMQDEKFICHALGKSSSALVEGFLASGLEIVTYEKIRYLSILSGVKSDGLTDLLVEVVSSTEECREIVKRFDYYTNWEHFAHAEFIVRCLKCEDLVEALLQVLSPERFEFIKAEHFEIFLTLVGYLPKFSLLIHEKLESYRILPGILVKALNSGCNSKQYEAILLIIQYSWQNLDLLNALIFELRRLNSEEGNEDSEYIKEMLLVTIRIQGSGVLVADDYLDEIIRTIRSQASIETKKNAVMTLCCFDEKNKLRAVTLLEHYVKNITTAEEYHFFKSILKKLENYEINGIVKTMMIFVQSSGMGMVEGRQLVKAAGSKYLNIFVWCFAGSDFHEILKSCLEFSVTEILEALDKLLIARLPVFNFIEFAFTQKEFLEKFTKKLRNDISEILCEIFSNIFQFSSDITKQKLQLKDKNSPKNLKKSIKSLMKTLNTSLDDDILSSTFSLLLQSSNYYCSREAIEYLLPRIESNPRFYYSMINPLCNILENNLSKISSLTHEKMEGVGVFLQLVLSLLYVLLKSYKDTSKILVVYGNCLLGYTQASKPEVQSAACLCFSTFFNEKSLEILPFLETYLEQVLSLCENPEEIINNCGFSCLGSIIMSSEEFLSPHTTSIIEAACRFSNIPLYKIIANHIPHRTLLEKLAPSLESLKSSPDSLANLFELCKHVAEKVQIHDLLVLKDQVFHFYHTSLSLISHQKPTLIQTLSSKLGQSFSLLSLNFNNSQLKPGFLDIFHWSTEKTAEESYDYPRLLAFAGMVLNLTSKLKHLFVPYYSHFFEIFVDLLAQFSLNFASAKRKRTKSKVQRLLNAQVLCCFQQLAVHDSERYLSSDQYSQIAEVLSSQFKAVSLKKYSEFCEKSLTPTILAFLTNTVDQGVWQGFTYKVLLQARSASAETRVQALGCVSKALAAIGKEFAGLIGDIMPFVMEGLEDNDDMVTGVARTLLTQLESFCGEEIKNYIS